MMTRFLSQLQLGHTEPSTRGIAPKRAILDTNIQGRGQEERPHPDAPPLIQVQCTVVPRRELFTCAIECVVNGECYGRHALLEDAVLQAHPSGPYVGHTAVDIVYRQGGAFLNDAGALIPFCGDTLQGLSLALEADGLIYRKPFKRTELALLLSEIELRDEAIAPTITPPGGVNQVVCHPLGGCVPPRAPLDHMVPVYGSVLFEEDHTACYLDTHLDLFQEDEHGESRLGQTHTGYQAVVHEPPTPTDAMSVAAALTNGQAQMRLTSLDDPEVSYVYHSHGFQYEDEGHRLITLTFHKT